MAGLYQKKKSSNSNKKLGSLLGYIVLVFVGKLKNSINFGVYIGQTLLNHFRGQCYTTFSSELNMAAATHWSVEFPGMG